MLDKDRVMLGLKWLYNWHVKARDFSRTGDALCDVYEEGVHILADAIELIKRQAERIAIMEVEEDDGK